MASNVEFTELEQMQLNHVGLIVHDSGRDGVTFQGPIKIENIWFNIKLLCPNYPKVEEAILSVQQSNNIKKFKQKFSNINSQWSVEQLLENIPCLMDTPDKCSESLKKMTFCKPTNIYADIANVFDPNEYTVEINDLCSRVRFSKFSQYDHHYFELEMPSLTVLDHSLPLCLDWRELFGKATTLDAVLQQFRKCLEDLQPFYENFTDIDELCHVVQPSLPTTKENWRMFVLKERVFLKLQFSDPFSPLASMSVHIIGPTPEVTHLRHVYSEGLQDWDGELDVHKNLMRIFDLCFFPMPPTDDAEDFSQFCNICYSYKLERGDIPFISCDNPNCSLIFHAECLKEWFSTLADGKTFLEVAFGECPFCKAKLSTSFQELLQI